jgi:hypothetical protein
MIPLASDLLPFPGQMRREDLLKSASLPDQLSSSGRIVILDSISQNCPELLGGAVDKTISRGKQATESAQQLDRSSTRLRSSLGVCFVRHRTTKRVSVRCVSDAAKWNADCSETSNNSGCERRHFDESGHELWPRRHDDGSERLRELSEVLTR